MARCPLRVPSVTHLIDWTQRLAIFQPIRPPPSNRQIWLGSRRRSVYRPALILNLFLSIILGGFISVSMAKDAVSAAETVENMRFQRLLTGEEEDLKGIGGILDIIQDDIGYVWIAGENGLAKYDAHSFTFYYSNSKNPRALASNWIADLAIDRDGQLWLATANGLSRYNRVTDDFVTYHSSGRDTNSISHDVVSSLAVDENNNLFIGTGDGLSVLNSQRDAFRQYFHDPEMVNSLREGSIRELFLDAQNRLWIGFSGAGVSRFIAQNDTFTHWQHSPQDPTSLTHGNVQGIGQDAHGRIWIGTDSGGLSRLEADEQSFKNYRHIFGDPSSIGSDVIQDIHTDQRGNLWIATDHGGLALYDEASDSFVHSRHHVYDRASLNSDQLRAIYEDRTSNLWVGAVPTGVNFYDISKAGFRTLVHEPYNSNSLSHNGVLCLFEDSEGILWIGTESGLNAYDRNTRNITRYLANPTDPDSLRFGAVTSVTEDLDGKLWVATWSGGLHLFDKKTQKFKNYFPEPGNPNSLIGPHIWSVVRDEEGTVWMGANQQGGVSRYVRETDSFVHYRHNPDNADSLIYNYVWKVLPDSKGNLWVGTMNGLDRFDKHRQKFFHFRHDPNDPASISSNNVMSIIEDSQGFIWLGTEGGGVNMLNPQTGESRAFSIAEGLPSANVAAVIEDKAGDIWAATASGLARIDRTTFAIKVLHKSDGLAGNITNRDAAFVADNGDLYIGSTDGVTVFNPQILERPPTPPKVVITSLRILNKRVPVGAPGSALQQAIDQTDELVLSYKDSMFALDFAALSFRSSSQNRYAYRLEGFDQTWHDVGHVRTATYTNLGPGRYTFRAKARNSAGVWSEEDAQIDIVIQPPPWRTSWAYAGYLALLIFAFYLRKQYVNLKLRSNEYKVLSTTDPLTGALNRAGIIQEVGPVLANTKERRHFSVMLFDIDHFKRVNDTRGHDAGDRILQAFARIIASNVRTQDSLGRWGGEEFILVCRNASAKAAVPIAETLRSAVANHLFEKDARPLHLTVSIGVASLREGETFEEVVKRADLALYKAKSNGRNCVVLA